MATRLVAAIKERTSMTVPRRVDILRPDSGGIGAQTLRTRGNSCDK